MTEQSIDKYEPQSVQRVTIVSGQTATVTFNNVLKRGDLKVIVFFPEVSLSVVDLVVYLCQNCAAGGMGASPHTR